MTSCKPNYLQMAPSLNTITAGVRIYLTQELVGGGEVEGRGWGGGSHNLAHSSLAVLSWQPSLPAQEQWGLLSKATHTHLCPGSWEFFLHKDILQGFTSFLFYILNIPLPAGSVYIILWCSFKYENKIKIQDLLTISSSGLLIRSFTPQFNKSCQLICLTHYL